MVELLTTITPWLDTVRSWILKGAEFISGAFDVSAENVFLVLLIIISIWGARKLLMFFYATLEGRIGYWAILAAGIFGILKYL